MIKKGKVALLQYFPMDLFSAGVNVYMRCHESSLPHSISLIVNYHFFAHSELSYRFNGENDKGVIELFLIIILPYIKLQ